MMDASLLQLRPCGLAPTLDQIGLGRQSALQRAERERDHIVIVGIRNHDLAGTARAYAAEQETPASLARSVLADLLTHMSEQ